ncbi:hypothetical protein [Sphingomonas sp. GM_Shp_2]|uniref:hypothetical protein n=1 Tax=Sphingomonas sp. GM_Shp_2 TaxID=2937380 RepID=UPI002269974F|nr:hypothetical protein [Sphingomonas sp. GM_Shp_2]
MMGAVVMMLIAQGAPFAAAPVADTELAEQRGGFRLPSGIDVALTVQTQTAINGAVVLRTVFRTEDAGPSFAVYTPRPGETVAARGDGGQGGAPATTPVISYDRATGIHVTRGAAVPGVTITGGAASAQSLAAGLQRVGDASAATDAGWLRQATAGATRTATLEGQDLSITHFAGAGFGSLILNTGDDRAIDTQTSVSIALANAGPDVLGSAMFRAANVGIEAAMMRAAN